MNRVLNQFHKGYILQSKQNNYSLFSLAKKCGEIKFKKDVKK